MRTLMLVAITALYAGSAAAELVWSPSGTGRGNWAPLGSAFSIQTEDGVVAAVQQNLLGGFTLFDERGPVLGGVPNFAGGTSLFGPDGAEAVVLPSPGASLARPGSYRLAVPAQGLADDRGLAPVVGHDGLSFLAPRVLEVR